MQLYRQLGLAVVTYELGEVTQLTDALALIQVRWLFHDVDGDLSTDSRSYYLLRDEESPLRATGCIQVDDLKKLQALAQRLGIELPGLS